MDSKIKVMPMEILTPVHPKVLTKAQVHCIMTGLKDIGYEPKEFIDDALAGVVHIWSWGTGLIGFEITENRKKERTMFVTLLSGKNFIQNMLDIKKDLEQIARDLNCTHICALTQRKGFDRLFTVENKGRLLEVKI